jgi:hypothetical protein
VPTDAQAQSLTTVLVGGVSQLYQGDLDLGRRAVEQLAQAPAGQGVAVEDLHYGAVAVAQRLEELRPQALILVGAEARGRTPGTVERRRARPRTGDAQTAIAEAVQGYVSIDLVVDVAAGLGALPGRVVAVEVEPASTATSLDLSVPGRLGLERALQLVREELRRTPLLLLAADVRHELARDGRVVSPALVTMRALLDELARFDDDGRWGHTFAQRDRLRARLAAGQTGEEMTALDWGLWWNLIEELDRLQRLG